MKKNLPYINKWLLPFSWMYGLGVSIRSKLFSWGVLKQKSFDLPIICVGNIAVGGTGKTPHVEYLIRLLQPKFKIAVLSRGYRRKTKGFVLADETSKSEEIGDEPFQIKHKFPAVTVAVDAKRKRGIETLLALDESIRPDVILLDDAFQHRYVKPSYIIILTEHGRPFYKDALMPAGRLRETKRSLDTVNTIIVTKCPDDIKPIDQRIITHEINPYPYQTLLFTNLKYGDLTPVFEPEKKLPIEKIKDKQILLIAGIANPASIIRKLESHSSHIQVLSFPDHHNFRKKDIKKITTLFDSIENDKIVITTEKDAARLMFREDLSDELRNSLYYLPIEISFVSNSECEIFNTKIMQHVEKNTRNSKLY